MLVSVQKSLTLKNLLLLPSPESGSSELTEWLCLAVENLKGFSTQPCVIRRIQNEGGVQVEVRRWSNEAFLPLAPPLPRSEALMLCTDGKLMLRYLDGTRHLRNQQDEQMVDEIYHFIEITEPTLEQLEALRSKAISVLYPQLYQDWEALNDTERLVLSSRAGQWQNIVEVLQKQDGPGRIHTLQLLLGEQTHATLKQEIIQAGLEGMLRPGVEVLPWLLAKPDWNLVPGLVAMSKNAVTDDPAAAWRLSTHPNTQVRLRLADLLTNREQLLEWLISEPESSVRERILLSLEQLISPRRIVSLLKKEKQAERREVYGWALVNWSTGITDSQDWKAMNYALYCHIGQANRQALKHKLLQHNRLGLRARLLG